MRVKKVFKKTRIWDNQKKDKKKNEMQLLEKAFYEKHFFLNYL